MISSKNRNKIWSIFINIVKNTRPGSWRMKDFVNIRLTITWSIILRWYIFRKSITSWNYLSCKQIPLKRRCKRLRKFPVHYKAVRYQISLIKSCFWIVCRSPFALIVLLPVATLHPQQFVLRMYDCHLTKAILHDDLWTFVGVIIE